MQTSTTFFIIIPSIQPSGRLTPGPRAFEELHALVRSELDGEVRLLNAGRGGVLFGRVFPVASLILRFEIRAGAPSFFRTVEPLLQRIVESNTHPETEAA